MRESRVIAALKALADNDRQRTAPSSVEATLAQAFRAHAKRRASRTKQAISLAAACTLAAAAAIVIVVMANRPRQIAPAPLVRVTTTSSPAVQTPEAMQSGTRAAAAVPGRRIRPPVSKHARRLVQNVAEERSRRELVTVFFPLMDPAPPMGHGEILRVQVPAAAMRSVGLPVSEDHLADRIQADVLVGEEGLPRAIRFVKVEMR